MTVDDSGLPLGEALRRHYLRHGFPEDGGVTAQQWTLVRVLGMDVRLSNYAWRKHALPCHDIHHLLTGYPCTVPGEFQMAAWEFAAGRFPHPCSTLFCLPLVGMGALASPNATFRAFIRGRRSSTLYSRALTKDLLAAPLAQIQEMTLPAQQPQATLNDIGRYILLVGMSFALMAIPAALAWACLSLLA